MTGKCPRHRIHSLTSFILYFLVPCAPSDLAVDIDCETNYAQVSWSHTNGTVKYFSRASSAAGAAFYCDSSNTSCTLKTLQCGDNYNFTVKAFDGACNSSESKPLQEGAGTRVNLKLK